MLSSNLSRNVKSRLLFCFRSTERYEAQGSSHWFLSGSFTSTQYVNLHPLHRQNLVTRITRCYLSREIAPNYETSSNKRKTNVFPKKTGSTEPKMLKFCKKNQQTSFRPQFHPKYLTSRKQTLRLSKINHPHRLSCRSSTDLLLGNCNKTEVTVSLHKLRRRVRNAGKKEP